MFSVIFPGQGSQTVGMGKHFFENYDLVRKLFKEADEILGRLVGSEMCIRDSYYKSSITIAKWTKKIGFFRCFQ